MKNRANQMVLEGLVVTDRIGQEGEDCFVLALEVEVEVVPDPGTTVTCD